MMVQQVAEAFRGVFVRFDTKNSWSNRSHKGERSAFVDKAFIEANTDFQIAEIDRNVESLEWHGNAILVCKGFAILGVEQLELPGLEPRERYSRWY